MHDGTPKRIDDDGVLQYFPGFGKMLLHWRPLMNSRASIAEATMAAVRTRL